MHRWLPPTDSPWEFLLLSNRSHPTAGLAPTHGHITLANSTTDLNPFSCGQLAVMPDAILLDLRFLTAATPTLLRLLQQAQTLVEVRSLPLICLIPSDFTPTDQHHLNTQIDHLLQHPSFTPPHLLNQLRHHILSFSTRPQSPSPNA